MKVRNKKGQFISTGFYKKCEYCGNDFYIKECNKDRSKYCCKKCSNKGMIGKKQSKEHIEKVALANTGKKRTLETKRKMSESARGEKNNQWKGGRVKLTRAIRDNYKYKEWLKNIYKRDGYKCNICGAYHIVGDRVVLDVHHLKAWSIMLDENKIKTLEEALSCNELWDENNGIVLCRKCHNKIHSGEYHKKLSEIKLMGGE